MCPTTELNAQYLARQREAFLAGTPGPDFPGGKGESEHVDRPTEEFLRTQSDLFGLQSAGFEELQETAGDSAGAKAVIQKANAILGF